MSGPTHSSNRRGNRGFIHLVTRPGPKHAEEVARRLAEPGEIVTVRPCTGDVFPYGDDPRRNWALDFRIPEPEDLAERVLANHAIQPHWNRTGAQVAALLTEAIRAAREITVEVLK